MEAVPQKNIRNAYPPSHLRVQQQTLLPCGGSLDARRDPSCLVDLRYRPPMRRNLDGCREWSVAEMKQQADFMRLLALGGEKNAINWANMAYLNAKSTAQHKSVKVVWVVARHPFSPGGAPSQLHLPQHCVDAEDSGPSKDFRVRDPVLPSQLQYSAKAAEMEVIHLPGLVRIEGPVLRSIKECQQDDGVVYLKFGV
ncbi:unnamed protein product [Schistocephalus solidus]|uniref:Uncharacterized protein n=1 Tax=Schistocephalus solidus TaxID=70667 RepID=A0A183TMW6_SCHSO|nr:unnamed protein product [Schistocephalus solidus]